MLGISDTDHVKVRNNGYVRFLCIGSATLRQWQRLATPHLGGIFESRPGVRMKVENKAETDTEPEVYTLSDYEEDGKWKSPPR